MKVFARKCRFVREDVGDSVPPAFVRTGNANEIHLQVCRIVPNARDLLGSQPSNSRVKKLAIVVESVEFAISTSIVSCWTPSRCARRLNASRIFTMYICCSR